jgi:NitT/TauT family transport system permease protein
MAYSKTWNRILNPLVYFTYPVPKTALLPVVMLLFGLGDSSKIIMIFLIVVFVVIVAVRDAVLNIEPQIYYPIKSLGASKWQIFKWITFPAILPELLTNMRVSIGTSLSILFFTEGYGTHYGIGYFILDAWTRIDYMGMYAGIVAISLFGFVLFVLTDMLEEAACKWKA